MGSSEVWAALDRWLAEGRTDEAAAQRGRARWARQIAAESATFAGVLIDLAERRDHVTLLLRSGRRHAGTITAVGADFVVLHSATADALVSLGALAGVRTDTSATEALGDRHTDLSLTLAEALASLAAERPRVLVHSGPDGVAGELRRGGLDVITLRLDNGTRSHLSTAGIDDVVLNP